MVISVSEPPGEPVLPDEPGAPGDTGRVGSPGEVGVVVLGSDALEPDGDGSG